MSWERMPALPEVPQGCGQDYVPATNWNNIALLEVCAKTDDLIKSIENASEVVVIFFERSKEHRIIVDLGGCSQNGTSSSNLVKKTMGGGEIENLLDRINEDVE